MPNFAHAITRRARQIIQDPKNWTPTASARDERDGAVNPLSPRATMFCGLGALIRAAHEMGYSERWLLDIFGAGPLGDLVRANACGHAEVLARLDKLGITPEKEPERHQRSLCRELNHGL